MVYFDNIKFSIQQSGGISVVWFELLDRIIRDSLVDYRMIDYPGAELNIFRQQLNPSPGTVIKRKGWPKLMNMYFNPSVKENNDFIFHSSHYRICTNPKAINFTTVHDFTYEILFKGLKENRYLRKVRHTWQKSQAINGSQEILCVSQNTKNDLLKFYPQIDEKHVHVVYNGVSDMFFPLGKKESTDSFIKESLLFVGSRDFYKNFEKGVKALAGTNFNLIIIGGGKLSEQELLLLNNWLGENRYRKYDYISTEDLNVLYNNARGLLYPSIYEGFGIPVLEAQKAGLPVIAFNGSSIPEVGGDAVIYFNNDDIDEIKECIVKLEDDNLFAHLSKEGIENAKHFSWEKNYQETLALYKNYDK